MDYEYAAFFKLLLLSGYSEELENYLDAALTKEDPLSDIVLALVSAGWDVKKMLSVLNGYLLQASDDGIDYDKRVFDLILSFLRQKYRDGSAFKEELPRLMRQIALQTDRYLIEPWQTMYTIGVLFEESEDGYPDKQYCRDMLEAFINHGVLLSDYPPPQKRSLFLKACKSEPK